MTRSCTWRSPRRRQQRRTTSPPQVISVLKVTMESHSGPRNMPIIDATTKLEGDKADLEDQ
eukprot:3863329-Lingulodinium_polyedra.AAC.1